MATPIPTRRKMLQVDFFTPAHRLSTQVNVFGHTLADQLNDPRVSWINLEMAYISRIEKPGEIIADYAISTLRKDQVSLAMISGSTEGAVKKIAHASTFYSRLLYRVWVATGAVEITGHIELTGKLDLTTLLVAPAERFMQVTSAVATSAFFPATQYTAELVLVNKDAIQVFCAEERGKPVPQE
jgi:hypothetical protein